MELDPNKLRQLTAEAVERGNRKRQQQEEARLAAEKRKQEANLHAAQAVIAKIPHLAEKEAGEGKSSAVVYKLKYHEDIDDSVLRNNFGPGTLESLLLGVGRLVYDFCVKSKLKTTVESWYSGDGMNGGYQIVIHW